MPVDVLIAAAGPLLAQNTYPLLQEDPKAPLSD
jgi:hypothetical protein